MNRAGPAPVVPRERALTVEDKQRNTLATVVEMLNRTDRNAQLRALLGSERAVENFKTVALHALSQNGAVLKDCTPESILEAVRESAVLGLHPTGLLGEGWILPYGSTAKFQPGYRGYLKLLQNSNEVQALDCQVVREKDEFSGVVLGTNPHIEHRIPRMSKDEDRGDYEGAYAWVRMRSGELIMEWMSTADIELIRRRSPSVRANRTSPWDTDWGEMARKTVIRRLVKRLPMATSDERLRELQLREAEADEAEEALAPKAGAPSLASAAATAALSAVGLDDATTVEVAVDPQNGTGAELVETDVPTDDLCGATDGSPLALGDCAKSRGHAEAHQSPGGTWPA